MSRRSLKLPREHGAWAMLYVPFVVGWLVAGVFSLPVVFLAISVTFGFIARESLVICLRARNRAQDDNDAWRLLIIYLSLAVIFGAPLVLIYQLFWLVPVGVATLVFAVLNARKAVRGQDRTMISEVLAIMALTLTAPAAYYVSGGVLDGTALWLWALCILYFASSVFYVKLRVSALNLRREDARLRSWRRCAFYHTLLLASLVVLALTGSLNLLALAAFLPVLVRSFWHLARPVRQLNLRQIGLLEIAYSVVFLIFTTLTFRF